MYNIHYHIHNHFSVHQILKQMTENKLTQLKTYHQTSHHMGQHKLVIFAESRKLPKTALFAVAIMLRHRRTVTVTSSKRNKCYFSDI